MADKTEHTPHFQEIHHRLARLLRLFVRLDTTPETASAGALCEELRVSRRTLFRDLKLLREVGVRIEHDVRFKHYFIKDVQVLELDRSDNDGEHVKQRNSSGD